MISLSMSFQTDILKNCHSKGHYQKVLCYQALEKMDKLFYDYQKLGLPTVQLVQWKNHYKFKVQHDYIMNGGTT